MDRRTLTAACARLRTLLVLSCAVALAACGGGGGDGSTAQAPGTAARIAGASTATDTTTADCDAADYQKILSAVPVVVPPGGGKTSLTVHYHRNLADYSGWQMHTWGAGADPGWNNGWNPEAGQDSFGITYKVPLAADTGTVGFLFHKGDTKDNGGADQSYTLHAGANEIWRLEGDSTNYTSNPLAGPPDLTRVRVHYKRADGNYAAWGLHLWGGSGLDTAGLPGVAIGDWNNPVPFASMPGYSLTADGVVFDIPVLNPKTDASRTDLQFIIHGLSPNQNDKDGRNDNIVVHYATLNIAGQIGEIWMQQQDPTVYTSKPDSRSASTTDARAYWLSKQLVQWPRIDSSGVFKLYYSLNGQIGVAKDAKVSGADGAITLTVSGTPVPPELAQRFKFIAAGVVLKVAAGDLAQLPDLHTKQLVLVQEDADGNVQNATTLQIAGAMDDLYSAATGVADLGATVGRRQVGIKLWAPTAQQVKACVYDSGSSSASALLPLTRDSKTGVWSTSQPRNLEGKYYTYLVDVFVRGIGVIRNRVTDPYSLSLTTNSRRTQIVDLDSDALKPAGWDRHGGWAGEDEDEDQPFSWARESGRGHPSMTQEDMVIYELHVRDFSANDASVPEAHRGKYLAFTDKHSDGMKHLRALARAGLTDVHLLPVFDLATVPESGCVTPAIPAGTQFDSTAARDAINAVKDQDCFNWGYDPFHYTTPEGSYATDAADGSKRVIEFRQMVMALHKAGLRVGMDVVYNHTTAAGQLANSVLDRIVPGYYQRLSDAGAVLTDSCCSDTASENAMMGKLMIDSVKTWATEYQIDSFRFDIMSFHPRAVMERLRDDVNAAVHDKLDRNKQIFIVGEGWNFGAVANDARFVQASQLSLNGSGIGTFNDRGRDAIRGGGPFDGGQTIVHNQGYISGLFYDDNGSGGGKTLTDLLRSADMVRVGLAGSIRDYSFTNYLDVPTQLQQIDYNGQPAGYVVDPQETVNYMENHDNQTLFDISALKLPTATSLDDRARVQMLGVALNAFSQGVAYYHAGVDTLRSKSLDTNSYNAGDWFNRLDWTYSSNNYAVGLPVSGDDTLGHQFLSPALAPALTPGSVQIKWMRDVFRDLLAVRSSTPLFRLRTGADVKSRLRFYNTGSNQIGGLIVADLDGRGYPRAGFDEVMYFVNVDKVDHTITLPGQAGKRFRLHPVQAAHSAADQRVRNAANDACNANGSFAIPARSAVVCVLR